MCIPLIENHCKTTDYRCKITVKWWMEDFRPKMTHLMWDVSDTLARGKHIKTLSTHSTNIHNLNCGYMLAWSIGPSESQWMYVSFHRCTRFTACAAHYSKASTSSETNTVDRQGKSEAVLLLFWTELLGKPANLNFPFIFSITFIGPLPIFSVTQD